MFVSPQIDRLKLNPVGWDSEVESFGSDEVRSGAFTNGIRTPIKRPQRAPLSLVL